MINKIYNFLIFLLIFSFINDNFFVDKFGESSLKVLFISFLIISSWQIIYNIKKMTMYQDKIFFIYFFSLIIAFLIQNFYNTSPVFFKNIMTIVSIFFITVFFSFYNIKMLLYFFWTSVLISVIICFFNEPISEYTFRTSGGTGDPNEFATQLLIFLVISIYLFKENNSKIFISLSFIFFTFGIFNAGSKSSFLTLAVLLLVIFWFKFKYIFSFKRLLVLSILIIVSVNYIDFSKLEFVSNMIERAESSGTAGQRFVSWYAGYNMIQENLFVGVGFNQFIYNTEHYTNLIVDAAAAHNILIKLFAESGIIVFFLFLYYFYTIGFKPLLFNYKEEKFILYTISIIIFFMGLTLSLNYDKYFLLMLALLMNLNRKVWIK